MSIQYGRIAPQHFDAFRPLLPEEFSLQAPHTYAAGAVQDGVACGVLVFRADELTADILWLAVAETHRRQGIATGLIDFLCRSAWETGTALLCTFAAPNRDAPLCRLLTRRGDFTVTETEDYICRFPCRELADIKLPAVPADGCQMEPFYQLPEHARRAFFTPLKEDNAAFAHGLQEEEAQMLAPLCLCMTEHGAVQAAIFCQNQDGNVLLRFAWASPGHPYALAALTGRLRELLVKAADKVPYLCIAAVTPESRKLTEILLSGREVTERFYTACWDMNTMGG